MAKKAKHIKVTPEAEKMIEEIRDANRHFNLSGEVEALIRRIHAETVKATK